MKATHTALAAALACAMLPGLAQAQSLPKLKFSGFGTLAAVHSNEKNADYTTNVFQPNGAGHTDAWSFAPDSKLGGQVNAVFNDKWSAVVQVVAQHQADNSYTPLVEWANLKYQVTPGLSVRAGRIATPSYMLSDSRFVGYANPWVRPPIEVYSVLAITSNDGVDATYRSRFGNVNNTLQAYYGNSTSKLSSGKAKANPGWGLSDSVEVGAFSFRAGYTAIDLDLTVPSIDGLFTGLNQFAAGAGAVALPAYQSASAQATALANKYKLDGMALSAVALGASYDPGQWFVMAEFVDFKGDGFLADSRSWYVSSGYRFASFTPYATLSRTRADVVPEAGISTAGASALAAGAAGLNAGINASLNSFSGSQDGVSVGVRWDFMKNVALKTQYDRINVADDSNGRMANVQPAFKQGGHVDLFSVALDFVF